MSETAETQSLSDCLVAAWNLIQDNAADRASLVRVRTPSESMFVPSYHRALNVVRHASGVSSGRWLDNRMCLVVPAFAKIRENDPTSTFAQQLAASKGERPLFSTTRFRRLLQAADDADLLSQTSTAIAVLRRTANVADLGKSLLYWKQGNDWVRQEWALAYFGAAPQTRDAAAK